MHTRTFTRTLGIVLLAAAAAACESGTSTPAVDTVIIEADDSQVVVGGTLQLRATAYDENGDIITGRPVIWTSSDQNIATVGASGLLTGLQPGTVDITAQIGGEQDTQTFDVVSLCPVTPYTIGTTVNGILASTDCTFQDGTYVDYYGFTLANPRQVTITLRSSQIDAYLVLFSSDAEVIEEDDDDGGGNDAQIVRTLPPGTYYIAANSFAIETGPYTLTTAAAP
ncbi:MAG TPA: DVUA0089 family protein [Longimicrobium sp.]|nr:DVUA0089 family protein [Longimicrobium sp.]